MKRLQLSQEALKHYIQQRSRVLLHEWNQEEAIKLIDELSEHGVFDDVKL